MHNVYNGKYLLLTNANSRSIRHIIIPLITNCTSMLVENSNDISSENLKNVTQIIDSVSEERNNSENGIKRTDLRRFVFGRAKKLLGKYFTTRIYADLNQPLRTYSRCSVVSVIATSYIFFPPIHLNHLSFILKIFFTLALKCR